MRRLLFVLLLASGIAACGDDPPEVTCDQCGVCDDNPINDCVQDCAGVWGGTAKLDACGLCVGGNTGNTACVIDCAGTPNGTATVDECGVCDDNPDNDCVQDCAGVWGGHSVLDECGVCDDNVHNDCVQDCADVWGGTATVDACGVCDDDPDNDCAVDCRGVSGGDHRLDMCGTCDNDPENDCTQDCAGVWGGVMVADNCGVCDADPTNDDTTCVKDCNGDWAGTAEIDACGTCAGGNTGITACEADCHGVPGGAATLDMCGVCDDDPDNDCVQDCAGVWGGASTLDMCGVCDDDPANDCAQDCAGEWGGASTLDMCGVCDDDPDNDCAQDCAGEWGGTALVDDCGVCDTNPLNDNTTCVQDCAGVWAGTAVLDDCGVCAGGNTGVTACAPDCNGVYDGEAVFDACGNCVGGDTGAVACANWCEPFADTMTSQTHPHAEDPGAYRNHVTSDASPFGYIDELVATDNLKFTGELRLPAGQWAVNWRVAGGTDRFPLTLTVAPVSPADCAAETSETWAVAAQPDAGQWGTSPDVAVEVTSAGTCTVRVTLENADEGDVKTGYAFNWVRATPLCADGDADLCPAVVGATASCVSDRCVYTAGDADADGLCDAVDRCDLGDDRIDADHDGTPAACDCNDQDASVHPAAMEVCGGGDNDCNGLDASEEGAFLRHVTMTGMTLVPAAGLAIVEDLGSMFSSVVVMTPAFHTGPVSVSGGPATQLRPGRYVADFRAMRGSGALTYELGVATAAGRDCLTPAQASWLPTNPSEWEISPKVPFEVTDTTCPVYFSITNSQGINKAGTAFDWVRLRHGCDASADCPAYVDATASCNDGVCEYNYQGGVCEP